MDNFFIVANELKDPGLKMAKSIQEYLLQKGKQCRAISNENRPLGGGAQEADKILGDAQCILVLGGDGTLLQVSRDVLSKNIPIIGVNRGNVGYLCELEAENIRPALDKLMEDSYILEKRMMLSGKVYSRGKLVMEDTALNEVVIHRGGNLKILDFTITVNGEHLYTYGADGIIAATPTGSTGYSMSAGGPIVDPKARLILITPINPHELNRKSIILDAADEIVVTIGMGRRNKLERAKVTVDGDKNVRVASGDRVVISQSDHVTRILKINRVSFLETLRKKMQGYR